MDIFRPFLDIVRQCKNQMGVSECQKFHYVKMDIVRQCKYQIGVSECQKFHYIKMDIFRSFWTLFDSVEIKWMSLNVKNFTT